MKQAINRQNIVKFVVAFAAFYGLLTINVFHVGEIIAPIEKDYSQLPMIDTGFIDSTTRTHQVAPTETQTFDTICTINEKLCKEISFDGTYTEKEKYTYGHSILSIVRFINTFLITKQKVEDSLENIWINKDSGARRGYAKRYTIVFNLGAVQTQAEFIELITHEMGHILDLGVLQGKASQKHTKYTEFGEAVFGLDDISLKFYALSWDSESIRKAESSKKDFCSGYGMSDPFEDFSECLNLYMHHNYMFRLIAKNNAISKKKYNFIAGLFDGNFINPNKSDVSKIRTDISRRPWDSTRIN